ncbi:Gfo/Idh/MocA family oxidoreductase [Garicola koreensis]
MIVVGAGAIGRRHIKAVRQAGDTVTAVVDTDIVAAREAARPAGSVAQTSLAKTLADEDADVAVIATPSGQHLDQSVLAVRAGLDVLVEKPHRVPGEVAAGLRASLGGRRYFVAMTTRHWPGIEATAHAIADGSLGQILTYTDRMHFRLAETDLPPWYFDATLSGGGVLLTNGVHAIDRARALVGPGLELDGARLVRVFPSHRCEDSAEIQLRNHTGIPVHLSLLWSPYASGNTGLTVNGTRGSAVVHMDGSWQLITGQEEQCGPAIEPDEPFARQWQAFKASRSGFDLEDLEPTLGLVERIYRRYTYA